MRLLDRMVSDLIRNATGYNARGLVRRVGGKNILLMGGAALAGGLLAERGLQGQQARRSGGVPSPPSSPTRAVGRSPAAAAVPPPPPPPPGSGAAARIPPPPPPAVPPPAEVAADAEHTVADEVGELSSQTLFVVVRSMVAAALADGELDAEEKALIEKHLDEPVDGPGLSERQAAQVRRDLLLPALPKELADALPAGEDAEVPLRFACLVVMANGEASEVELAFLDRLARALGISETRQREIVAEIFPAAR